MSYCRWSSDSFRCDLYCYEDCRGGWTTHVAGRKRIMPDDFQEPPFSLIQTDSAEWVRQHKAFMDGIDKFPFKDIGLPHAGETFNDPTIEEFRDRVAGLITLGYNVPDCVIAEIDEEIADKPAASE